MEAGGQTIPYHDIEGQKTTARQKSANTCFSHGKNSQSLFFTSLTKLAFPLVLGIIRLNKYFFDGCGNQIYWSFAYISWFWAVSSSSCWWTISSAMWISDIFLHTSHIIHHIWYIYILHDKFDMSWYEYPTTSHVTGEAALFHRWCGFALPMWHCFWSFLLQSWVFKVPFGKQPSSFLKVADLFLKGTWGNPALNITGWIAPQELQICSHWNLCVVGKKAK